MAGVPLQLKELWACECTLESIEALINLINLETLHLYDAGLTSTAILGQLKARHSLCTRGQDSNLAAGCVESHFDMLDNQRQSNF